ncbi:MAG: hypothetical protein JJT78_06965 [Leptospira sp.]|nr:hypothetical protein [Leptospira sp.]
MKKLITHLLLFIFFSLGANCLAFKESDLDPNSNLSFLTNFLKINEINGILNSKQAYTIEFEVVPRDGSPDANAVLVTPVEETSNSLIRLPTIPENGKFFSAALANQFEVLLEGKNLYKFQLYNKDGENYVEMGSFELDVFAFSNLSNTQPLRVVGNFSIVIKSIQRLDATNGIPFSMIFGQRSMGTFGGRSFRLGAALKIGSFNPGIPFTVYPIFLYTADGINYDTILFKEFPTSFDFSNFLPNFLQVTNGIQVNDNLLFLASRQIFTNGEPDGSESFVITLPLNNPQGYSIRKIQTPTNTAVYTSSNKTLFSVGNGILYIVEEISEPFELFWRYDLDLLVDGSRNYSVDILSGSPFLNPPIRVEQYRGDLVIIDQMSNFINYIKESEFVNISGDSITVNGLNEDISIPGVASSITLNGLSSNSNGMLYAFTSDLDNQVHLGYNNQNLPDTPFPIDFTSISSFAPNFLNMDNYISLSDDFHHFIEFSRISGESQVETILIRTAGNQGGQIPIIPLLENSDPLLRSVENTCEISGDNQGGLWCIHLDNTGRFFSTRLNPSGTWENWSRIRPLARFPD